MLPCSEEDLGTHSTGPHQAWVLRVLETLGAVFRVGEGRGKGLGALPASLGVWGRYLP